MLLTTEVAFANPRRGWATLISFALQTAVVAAVLAIPILRPGLLPQLTLSPPLVPLVAPRDFVSVVAHSPAGSSVTPQTAVLTAPWKIPTATNRGADPSPSATDEPPCVSCLVGLGPSGPVIPGAFATAAVVVAPPPPAVVEKPRRISIMMDGLLLHRVQPDYPARARQVRVQGAVIIAALISKEGTIENLRVLSGHPMLIPAAISAVKQWRYRPYILNGDPIEVDTQITVNFLLSGN